MTIGDVDQKVVCIGADVLTAIALIGLLLICFRLTFSEVFDGQMIEKFVVSGKMFLAFETVVNAPVNCCFVDGFRM